MKDLTQGPIVRHIVSMAVPIALGMIFQTLYYLVDLYFVAHLGDAAIAGVGAAGNIMFIVMGLTQVLGVGTVALISHAVGRKDQPEANLIFNQSIVLSGVCGLITLVGGYAITHTYMAAVAADEQALAAGQTYLYWFLPGMALQFALVSMGSALRGTGIVQPTMVVQVVTVVLNIVLAPILIAGWGTGYAMGVAGAGLASTIALVAAVVTLSLYFIRLEKYVSFHPEQWRPRMHAWKRMLAVGLPSGGEFLLLFVFMGVIYWCIRDFGATAQAGFGIGSRVMQSIFLPVMAIAFAAGPIAGQNFGARHPERVRETFRKAVLISVVIMAILTLLAHVSPELLVGGFTDDPAVRTVAATFLAITSWNFVSQGIIFTCSSMFQGLGDTRPALISTGSRVLTFALPAIWMSSQPWFEIHHLWYLSVATVTFQAVLSWLLLRSQFKRRLATISPVAVPA
ncbi:putative MATE family efflux protein [Povalibacter uvarum]|uniref:Multidrug-efflux transporter n=1 Tax=Povalibacter uvarum TaxID=732238 RepID=A0A841HR62_9GAMM|nr:MATE family efflux transporter [Povalibacter uvarum]MBB6094710.1 putative MATE family efflux protein [Povalibacter uvarum]